MITNYLHRAYKITNTWKEFTNEIEHIKQMFINKFTNTIVDKNIKYFINKKMNKEENKNNIKNVINLYYNNQMHRDYKLEERIIKDIVKRNTKCKNDKDQLKIIFYYKKNSEPIN